PGLRAGYVLAPDDDTAERLRRRRPRWSVNGLAASALPDLLAAVDLEGWATSVTSLRRQLVSVLQAHGFEPWPSDPPFLLVPGAAGLRERLARRLVLVRDCTSFGLPGHVRVTVPDEAGVERL